MSEVHVGDIGTKFIVTVMKDDELVDISTATGMKIYFEKPDGTILTKDAVFVTDGTDGEMCWQTTVGTDLDLEGQWKIQGEIEIGGGTWKTQIGVFRVYENIV